MNNVKKLFDKTSCWIIIHLGTNPLNGGRPPSDNNLISTLSLRTGLWFSCVIKWLKWNACVR